ncbi:MAG: phospholipase D-like domain-containing protein [Betaproteobacteria bacterium]
MTRHFGVESPAFARQLGLLLGPAFVDGNQVKLLRNGDQIFPAMLAAINAAQVSVTFETYIYWSGDVGKQFADALSECARRGVKVHVLLDWVGSAKMDQALLDAMTDSGVEIRRFHRPNWSNIDKMNNRTHRKLLVVDGRIGFTGGVGVAQLWTGDAQDPDHWRDSHFQLTGPAVAQMQATFMENWTKDTGKVLYGPAYFPPLAPTGDTPAQVFSSSPGGGSENMQLMYLLAIAAASRTIDLSASYFVPDARSIDALVDALKRGVVIRIIVPGEMIDSEIVRKASRAQWGALLANGALIAEYQPTMFHCKVMVVDGYLVSVGSTNFDNRSFKLNDEATLNILSHDFAAEQVRVFETDLARARPVTYAQWLDRPLQERAQEWFASLLRSQL